MEQKIEKKFYFQDVSSYGNTTLNVPEGYRFFQFITRENGNVGVVCSTVVAVYVQDESFTEFRERLEKEKAQWTETQKKFTDEKLAEKIQEISGVKEFVDILSKFKLGDSVYYYYDGYSVKEKIEDNIKSFTLKTISLEETQITFEKENEEEEYVTRYLILKDWGEKVPSVKAFKTKEEAIEGSKEYHELKLKRIEESRILAEKQSEERKEKEEEEILRKAEEIKNKQQ